MSADRDRTLSEVAMLPPKYGIGAGAKQYPNPAYHLLREDNRALCQVGDREAARPLKPHDPSSGYLCVMCRRAIRTLGDGRRRAPEGGRMSNSSESTAWTPVIIEPRTPNAEWIIKRNPATIWALTGEGKPPQPEGGEENND